MLIALSALRIGGAHCKPGDLVETTDGRDFTYDIARRAVLDVPAVALPTILAAAMREDDDKRGSIETSAIQPKAIKIGSKSFGLERVARAALARSGLSLLAWNALPEPAREMLIIAEADALWGDEEMPVLDAGAGTPETAGPGDPPAGPHVLFDPNVHALKYGGKHVGHTIIDKGGEVVARISKKTNAALKQARADNRRTYAAIIEDGGGR